MTPLLPRSTLFLYTTLFRSHQKVLSGAPRGADPWGVCGDCEIPERLARPEKLDLAVGVLPGECFSGSRSFGCFYRNGELQSCTDRKSTRLNSSHRCISYAVF